MEIRESQQRNRSYIYKEPKDNLRTKEYSIYNEKFTGKSLHHIGDGRRVSEH